MEGPIWRTCWAELGCLRKLVMSFLAGFVDYPTRQVHGRLLTGSGSSMRKGM